MIFNAFGPLGVLEELPVVVEELPHAASSKARKTTIVRGNAR